MTTFRPSYHFRKSQNLFCCIVTCIILQSQREISQRILSYTDFRNETAQEHLGILHPFFPFWRSSPNHSCGKSIDKIILRATAKGIYTSYPDVFALYKRTHLIHQRSLTHTTRRNQYRIHSIRKVRLQAFCFLSTVGKGISLHTNTEHKRSFFTFSHNYYLILYYTAFLLQRNCKRAQWKLAFKLPSAAFLLQR